MGRLSRRGFLKGLGLFLWRGGVCLSLIIRAGAALMLYLFWRMISAGPNLGVMA